MVNETNAQLAAYKQPPVNTLVCGLKHYETAVELKDFAKNNGINIIMNQHPSHENFIALSKYGLDNLINTIPHGCSFISV